MNSIKVNFNGMMKRFQIFENFERLREAFKKSYEMEQFNVYYLDDESELILIENEYDYLQALEFQKMQSNGLLRMTLKQMSVMQKPVLQPMFCCKSIKRVRNYKFAKVLSYYIMFHYEKMLKKTLDKWRSKGPDKKCYKLNQMVYRYRRQRVLQKALYKLKTYKPNHIRCTRFLHLFFRLRKTTLVRRFFRYWKKNSLPKSAAYKKCILANKIFSIRRRFNVKLAIDKWRNVSQCYQYMQERLNNAKHNFNKCGNNKDDSSRDFKALKVLDLKNHHHIKKYWMKWKYIVLCDLICARKIQKFVKLNRLKNAFNKIKSLAPLQIPNSEIFERLKNLKKCNEEQRNMKLTYLFYKHRLNKPRNLKDAFYKLKMHKDREALMERFERLRVRDKIKLISKQNWLKDYFYKLKCFLTRRVSLRKSWNKLKSLSYNNNLRCLFAKSKQIPLCYAFKNFSRRALQYNDLKYYTNKPNSSWKASYEIFKLKSAKPSKNVFGLQNRLKNAFLQWKRLTRRNFLHRVLLKLYLMKWKVQIIKLNKTDSPCQFKKLAFKQFVRKLKHYTSHKKGFKVREKFDSRNQRIFCEEQRKMFKLNKIINEQLRKLGHCEKEHVKRWKRLSQRFRAIVRVSKLLHQQVLNAHF
jgi:hypothetical protein